MVNNPIYKKPTKGAQNLTLTPLETPSISTKVTNLQDSPLTGKLEKAMSSIFLQTDESPLIANNSIPWSPSAGSKTELRSLKTQKTNLDDKMLNCIEQIVEERQAIYKKSRTKTKMFFTREGTCEFPPNVTRERKIIERVENFIKKKGLEQCIKDKQFENKFEIFDQVKTFVDTRKLFQDPVEVRSSPRSPGYNIGSDFSNTIKLYELNSPRNSNQDTGRTPKNNPSEDFQSFDLGKTPRSQRTSVSSPRKTGLPSGAENKKPEKTTEEVFSNQSVLKELEIRRLYEELKEDAIRKLGPEIFERIKKKMHDPVQLRAIDRKRYDEIKKMRELRQELGDFSLGTKLIDNLTKKSRGNPGLQEEYINKFDNYLKNELKEDMGLFSGQMLPIRAYILPPPQEKKPEPFVTQRVVNNNNNVVNQEDEEEEEEKQIQLFSTWEQHKQKSREILKKLRNKIASVQKKEHSHEVSLSGRISSRNANLLTETSNRVTPRSPEDIKHDMISPLELELLTEPLSARGPLRKESFKLPIKSVPLKKSPISPQLRLTLEGDYQEGMPESYRSLRSDKGKPILKNKKRNGRAVTFSTKEFQEVLEKKKAQEVIAAQKGLLVGICHDLESLASTNKDLNKQLEASIKEMDSSYAKKTKMVKNLKIPESLQKPPASKFLYKSSAKLAASLASKLYLTRHLN